MGSAYKNIGVQLLLDGVGDYLPDPSQVKNFAFDDKGNSLCLKCNSSEQTVAYAFKLDDGRFGQLTYMRVYQGSISRGALLINTRTAKRLKVPRLVRMHASEMEDVDSVGSGEICAIFGVDCATGDTFISPTGPGDSSTLSMISMSPMHVPDPVISLAIRPKLKDNSGFSRALAKFQKEDPTFRMHIDPETQEVIISGMGELHLEIYIERMKREYGCEVVTGKPRVAFRETIRERISFDYLHKKQTGGSGQFGRVIGYIEPITTDWNEICSNSQSTDKTNTAEALDASMTAASMNTLLPNEFSNQVVGGTIPPQFIPACEKGFYESCQEGLLIAHPITNLRMVMQEGASHIVDSNEHAFRAATKAAFREGNLVFFLFDQHFLLPHR